MHILVCILICYVYLVLKIVFLFVGRKLGKGDHILVQGRENLKVQMSLTGI